MKSPAKERRIRLPNALWQAVSAILVSALNYFGLQQAAGQSAPRLASTTINAGKIALNWSGDSYGYDVQTTTNLASPDWKTVLSTVRSNVVIPALGDAVFYRVLAEKTNAPTLVQTVTNLTTGEVFRFTLAPRTNANWVLTSPANLNGTNWAGANLIRITVTPENLSRVDLAFDGAGSFALVDTNGVRLGIGGTITFTPGPGPEDVSFSGILTNGTSAVGFSGVTDPSPVLVGLITVIAMLFCTGAYAVSVLACAANSFTCGIVCTLQFKQTVFVANWNFNWKDALQSGDLYACAASCSCECK